MPCRTKIASLVPPACSQPLCDQIRPDQTRPDYEDLTETLPEISQKDLSKFDKILLEWAKIGPQQSRLDQTRL